MLTLELFLDNVMKVRGCFLSHCFQKMCFCWLVPSCFISRDQICWLVPPCFTRKPKGGPVNRMGTERQKEGAVEGSVSNKVLTTPRDSRNVESREQIPLISVNRGQHKRSCILSVYCWPWFSPNCEAKAYPGSLIRSRALSSTIPQDQS